MRRQFDVVFCLLARVGDLWPHTPVRGAGGDRWPVIHAYARAHVLGAKSESGGPKRRHKGSKKEAGAPKK